MKKIGAIARPDDVIFAADLPKTRSGKIMRRLLRDIAEGKDARRHHDAGRSGCRGAVERAVSGRALKNSTVMDPARIVNKCLPDLHLARGSGRRRFHGR